MNQLHNIALLPRVPFRPSFLASSYSFKRSNLVMSRLLSKRPRRFAPLKEGSDENIEGLPTLKGIIFDADGTLWSVNLTSLGRSYLFHDERGHLIVINCLLTVPGYTHWALTPCTAFHFHLPSSRSLVWAHSRGSVISQRLDLLAFLGASSHFFFKLNFFTKGPPYYSSHFARSSRRVLT
jgi:hypothetical protein